MRTIYFTVTNDLSYDQRMHRICGSLAGAGYNVVLVGRKLSGSIPLPSRPFAQKRLNCFFARGMLFYAEYNLRLFFFLLFKKMDGICAIDLDTILPCLLVSKLKSIPRVYDAHEYFTELKEVRSRPRVQRIWLLIERFAVPRFKWGYTVSQGLVDAFRARYQRQYGLIRNFPVLQAAPPVEKKQDFLLYQGAVNEGRGFEYLIPAMKHLPYKLVVCGDGNFMPQLKELIAQNNVHDKVELRGMLLPEELAPIACQAALGMALAEKEGTNQYLALPNKFLDYIHAGLPQLAMAYPEYEKINSKYKVAVLLQELSPDMIARTVKEVMTDPALRQELHVNCLAAREVFCWQEEEKHLLEFYNQLFQS